MAADAIVTLHLETDYSSHIREGYDKLQEPYIRILSIATTPPPRGADHTLDLPIHLADRLIAYRNRYYDAAAEPVEQINCAHFVRYMCGHVDPDWETPMLRLDGIEGEITPHNELPAYHLGIIASAQAFRDSVVGYRHFLHGGIGLSGEWQGHLLNVSGLGGYLGLPRVEAMLDYNRQRVPKWYKIDPANLHLYDRGEV